MNWWRHATSDRATVITSNKSLREWGDLVGGDSALMMAILDRLLHRGEVFYLRGASYRMRGKEALLMGQARSRAQSAAQPGGSQCWVTFPVRGGTYGLQNTQSQRRAPL